MKKAMDNRTSLKRNLSIHKKNENSLHYYLSLHYWEIKYMPQNQIKVISLSNLILYRCRRSNELVNSKQIRVERAKGGEMRAGEKNENENPRDCERKCC